MKSFYSFEVSNSVLIHLGTDFIAVKPFNCKATTSENFEQGLDADLAIYYVGIKTYFKNNEPIAWFDLENCYGYKEH